MVAKSVMISASRCIAVRLPQHQSNDAGGCSLAGVPPTKQGYDAFVEMSNAIMAGRTAPQQKETVLRVLNNLLPSVIPWACRTFFRPTELTAMTCAYFAHIGFEWVRLSCWRCASNDG